MGKLENLYYIDGKMLAHLYTLAFAYRDTKFFYDLVLTDHHGPPLLPVRQDVKFDTDGGNAAGLSKWAKWLHNEPSLLQIKLELLKKKAEYIEDKINQLTKKIVHVSSKNKLPKHYDFFREIYYLENSKHPNISILLKKYAEQKQITYASLHRAYYRWKSRNAEKAIDGSSYISEAFCRFCARLSVKFTNDNQFPWNQSYFILNDSISLESIVVIRSVKNHFLREAEHNFLNREYDALADLKMDMSQKYEKMKKLALKNCLPAVEYCMRNLPGLQKEKFSLHAAILGIGGAQKDRGWKASGFCDLQLEPTSKNRLKIAQSYGFIMGAPIAKNTIIHSICVEVDCNAQPISELLGLLRSVEIEEPEYIQLCITKNKDRSRDMHMLSVKATMQNFDLLMKKADFLPSSMSLCFSSGHGRRKNVRNVQLCRIDNSPKH